MSPAIAIPAIVIPMMVATGNSGADPANCTGACETFGLALLFLLAVTVAGMIAMAVALGRD